LGTERGLRAFHGTMLGIVNDSADISKDRGQRRHQAEENSQQRA
jgi:hypothetical protein